MMVDRAALSAKSRIMRRALIIGASGGIGAAVKRSLEAVGVEVTGLSRSGDGFDVSKPESVPRILATLEGPFDLIFVAIGVLGVPEKSLGAIDAAAMAEAMAVNAIGPALILKNVPRLLSKDGICAVLSARVGSIGDNQIGGWYSYRASKAALNQIVHGAAIEIARSHKASKVVALHPGTVATSFTEKYVARHTSVSAEVAAQNMLQVLSDLTPDQSGGFFAYDGSEIVW
jgi:NAD(P)-dependent dehydrogenase (short-subunit alcohol dehydrogenase family)